MKVQGVILAFLCLLGAAALASTGTPRSVSVPAGDLIEGLESLAKQCGVDVIYPSGLLKGRKTRGVKGTIPPREAFKKLLEGTPLVLEEEAGALLVTQVALAPPPPPTVQSSATDPIDQVEIRAGREKLSTLRTDIANLEYRFYTEYNKLNTDHRYDIICEKERMRTGSHVSVPAVCLPLYVTRIRGEAARSELAGRPYPPFVIVMANKPGFQKNMMDVVAKHPELLALLKQRDALVQRYEETRQALFKKNVFVWD